VEYGDAFVRLVTPNTTINRIGPRVSRLRLLARSQTFPVKTVRLEALEFEMYRSPTSFRFSCLPANTKRGSLTTFRKCSRISTFWTRQTVSQFDATNRSSFCKCLYCPEKRFREQSLAQTSVRIEEMKKYILYLKTWFFFITRAS